MLFEKKWARREKTGDETKLTWYSIKAAVWWTVTP